MTRTDFPRTPTTLKYFPSRLRSVGGLPVKSVLVGLILATGLATNAGAQTESSISPSDPIRVVTRLHSGLLDASNAYADATMEERYAVLEPLIKETHDLPFIARFAMRRYWADLTDQQRSEFMNTFSRLSVATYASRFQGLNEDTFGISGQTDRPRGHVEVNGTLVQKDGEALKINYILHQSGEDWRIINIIVDGVSDLALKRAEFQRVFSDAEFSGLVAYLSDQIDEMMPASPADSE
jgi:phospholipid transport system substrate-binding protein